MRRNILNPQKSYPVLGKTSLDDEGHNEKNQIHSNWIWLFNQSAIVMYRLYHVALLGEEEMNPFLTAPKVLFDGLNEKGEPNL